MAERIVLLVKGYNAMARKMIIIFAGCLLLSGCFLADRYSKIHSLNGWKVIYADHKTIKEACRSPRAQGCAKLKHKVIYCPEWDFEICGHELHHATHGYFHHGKKWTRSLKR
jgi:hypothetical protein